MKNALSGLLFGIILFLASFGVLYWNEGRVDFSDIAKKATIINAEAPADNGAAQGLLVSASGTVTAEPAVGDDLYLQPGPYLQVDREVEMYAWVEDSEETTTTKSDGSQTTETTYSYSQEWVNSPADSSNFNVPEGHANPAKSLNNLVTSAASATVEQYAFTPSKVTAPEGKPVVLTADKVALTANATLANDTYIFVRNGTAGTYATPEVGDVRVSYTAVVVPFEGTVFGQLQGEELVPYVTKKYDMLYRVFIGTHDQALVQMHSEYTTALWIFRLVGFLMMWFGLAGLFGPIQGVLDFIPVLGKIGKAFIGFVTFVTALVLSSITIVVSVVLHNIWITLAVVVGVLVLGVVVGKALKKQKLAEHPEAATGG